MHDTKTGKPDPTWGRRRWANLTVVVTAVALLLGACGDDGGSRGTDADARAVMEEYRIAYNSGDVDATMALFTDNSVITGHPFEPRQHGPDEIRSVLIRDMAAAAVDTAYAFSNVEVTGNTVSWDHVWTRSDGSEACVEGHIAVIEDGKIMSWTWPDTDFSCS